MIQIDRCRDLLLYYEATGIVVWRGYKPGSLSWQPEAGTLKPSGYREIKVDGKLYKTHRLVWFLTHGTWPVGDIDHINGDKADNRISNLRDVSTQINCLNAGAQQRSPSAMRGIRWDPKRKKWVVQCCSKHLGRFDKEQDAIDAYLERLKSVIGDQTLPRHSLAAFLQQEQNP